MRCGQVRARAVAGVLCMAMLAGTITAGPALAVPLIFPTDQALIPLVVAGAFALPAVLAAFVAWLRRIVAEWRLAVGVGVLAVMALAIVGMLNPQVVTGLFT